MKRKIVKSLFSKMTVAFILLGIVPILIFSQLLLVKYSENMTEVMIEHMEQRCNYISMGINNIFQSVDESLASIYDYSFGKYNYLYSILNDDSIQEQIKRSYINNMLDEIIKSNEYISSIRFKTNDGSIYYEYSEKLKNIKDESEFANELFDITLDKYRDLFILPTVSEAKYCSNSDDYVFTIARNYMDCSTWKNIRETVLGTFYADINIESIEKIINQTISNNVEKLYVIDVTNQRYIYNGDIGEHEKKAIWINDYIDSIQGISGYVITGKEYIAYSNIGGTNYYVIDKVNEDYMLTNYLKYRSNIIIVISFGIISILIVYFILSRSFNKPVKDLKKAMEKIQTGNLNVRVNINTQDEMEYLGDGFNKMSEDLSKYINQVYKSSIARKDAELKALKMQIQPHYLYNTLDVIRMKAIEHDEFQVAELLESLSRQLRYLTNNEYDYVKLEDELNNIKEYFVIVSVRYNGLYELDINVNEDDLNLMVPKLILQPIVENSVKYGLRGRKGSGRVSINIKKNNGYLKIIIMDNGVGLSEEKNKEIKMNLTDDEDTIKYHSNTGSIGIKNIYNRMKYYYGKNYEFKIDGEEGVGTIVTYQLPIEGEEQCGEF